MKIHLLGTGAAEGIPALFASTRVSQIAREKGGREMRMRSAALIDGVLKIDFGPDSLAQIHRYGLDARDWIALVFTHSHDDHFAYPELQYFLDPFSDRDHMPFPIFGNEVVCRDIAAYYPDWPIELIQTKSFETYRTAEYEVTPIASRHIEGEDSQNLIITDGKVQFLYGTDTGVWREPTWEFLAGRGLDGIALECTEGTASSDYAGHLDIKEFEMVLNRLHQIGALKGDAKVVSTHHSHNGDATYDELVILMEKLGAEAGYDGMVFTVE